MKHQKLLLSVIALVAIATLTVAGTLAWFYGTQDQSATITTATIAIGGTWNFPLNFSNMLPGEQLYQDVSVRNGSNRHADFYVQLLSSPGGANFCSPTPLLDVIVADLDTGQWWYNGSICNLYPGWSGSTIVKVGEDVGPGVWKNYRVYLTLSGSTPNTHQDASNTSTVHLIAVQYNGPAPIPDDDGGTDQAAWPDDPYGDDDDPNYP